MHDLIAHTDIETSFTGIALADLDNMPEDQRNALPYGVIGLGKDNVAEIYNATEARLAGLSPAKVLGAHFFLATAPCMNNYLVAERFLEEPKLDATIDYVLTFRMRPTPVKLRLLQHPAIPRRYILVQR